MVPYNPVLSVSTSESAIPKGMACQIWRQLKPYAERPVLVAFSGGVDSTVLLHLLVTFRDLALISELSAVHVHHGLGANADHWENHCRLLCDQWQVPLVVKYVSVDTGEGDGIEQAARSLRYKVFEELLPGQGCLLQGHHRDDQAETLLFRLFRGTGLDGMAGIPAQRPLGQGVLVRPLLGCSRADIEQYSQNHQLVHIEDESNQDQRFARNYLRKSLVPEIERRWPGVSGRLAWLADDAARTRSLVQEAVAAAAASVIEAAPEFWGVGPVISLEALLRLSDDMATRVVRFWLAEYNRRMPDRQMLALIFSEVIHSREDAEPVLILDHYEVRRFHGRLVLLPQLPDFQTRSLAWDASQQKTLKVPGVGMLSLEGDGSAYLGNLQFELYNRSSLPRAGKVRVLGRSGSKTVKRWLQDYRVPPWLRDRVPFLFQREKMLAAAGIWVCDIAGDNPLDINSTGLRVAWRFNPCQSE